MRGIPWIDREKMSWFGAAVHDSSSPSGSTTSTQTSSPWSGQQPFLSNGFNNAAQLFYKNGVSDVTNGQNGVIGTGTYNPQYFGSPGTEFAGMSTVSPLNSNETAGMNGMIGQAQAAQPAYSSALSASGNISSGQAMYDNPGNMLYGSTYGSAMANPSNSVLSAYASADPSSPAWQNLVSSLSASITPQIEGQFTQGNAMNNPAAAYAVSSGLGSALSQEQLSAANQLSSNYQNAINEQNTAAQGISGNYNTGVQQQIQNEFALPSLSSGAVSNAGTSLDVGQLQQQQAQNELNNTVNMWNYNQNLPLNELNAYQSAISGNYGGTSSLTSPYFQNSTANAMGLGLGGLQGASLLSGMMGGGSSSGSSGMLGSMMSSL